MRSITLKVDDELFGQLTGHMHQHRLSLSETCRTLMHRGLDTPIVKSEIDSIIADIKQSIEEPLEANSKEMAILRKGANRATRASMGLVGFLSLYLPLLSDAVTGEDPYIEWASWEPDALFDFIWQFGGRLQGEKRPADTFNAARQGIMDGFILEGGGDDV